LVLVAASIFAIAVKPTPGADGNGSVVH
jgi:hypothetical protein